VPKVPQVEVKASASALPAMDGEKATASEKN
jgi:hypothetical protein